MIDYIKGKITDIRKDSITVESNNIGYLIIAPNPYLYNVGDDVKVYTYMYVKDEVFNLYGFKNLDEKKLFLKLISVSGIGPKSALAFLSTGSVDNIAQAINNGDSKYLCKFPGIGSKTAQQIVLDLKGKIDVSNCTGNYIVIDEVREALSALGYSDKDINKVLPTLDSTKKTSELVVEALGKILK